MEKKDDLAGIERIIGYHFFRAPAPDPGPDPPGVCKRADPEKPDLSHAGSLQHARRCGLKDEPDPVLMEKGIQDKGTITQVKEQLENNETLARIGRRMKIRRFIRLGHGARDLWRSGEDTIIADTMEAIIGAIFLDSDCRSRGRPPVHRCLARTGTYPDPPRRSPEKEGQASSFLDFQTCSTQTNETAVATTVEITRKRAGTTTGLPCGPP